LTILSVVEGVGEKIGTENPPERPKQRKILLRKPNNTKSRNKKTSPENLREV